MTTPLSKEIETILDEIETPTLAELTNSYTMGKDDGKAIGYAIGYEAAEKRRTRMTTALGWLVFIELLFIILILWK